MADAISSPVAIGDSASGAEDKEKLDDGYAPDDDLGDGDPTGSVVHYSGADWIDGVPTREDIVAEADTNNISETPRSNGKSVFFMPTDVEETNEYVNGCPVYVLKLYGPLMDGSKAEVTVAGIECFFDVRVPARDKSITASLAPKPSANEIAMFDAHLRQILANADVSGTRIKTVEAYPMRGYYMSPRPFKRVFTQNTQQRKAALTAVRTAGFETASDDRSSYYRKAAREYGFPLSEWATLSDYKYSPGHTDKSPLCTHLFRVPVASFRPLIDAMAPKEKREAGNQTKNKAPLLSKDRTLVLTWDIETHSSRKMGDVPDAKQHKTDRTFMICMTAHWKDDPAPLKQICIVDVVTAPDKRWTTVVCGSEFNLYKAFALCYKALAPDIMVGFNDSNYDWPFVVEKARKYEILSWMWNTMSAAPRRTSTNDSILRWNYNRDRKIKISSEEVFVSDYLKIPGCVPMDVRVCYKKLYPKSDVTVSGSLKFYLGVSGLPGKADMPYTRMWRYYETALAESAKTGVSAETAEHMRHVAHYCIIDASRCQQLLTRRTIVNDYREVSSLAYVSLFDSHYYAGGMKVCNLLGAYAWRRNILAGMIPNEHSEGGKYPGAYVFPPEKGQTPDPDHHITVDAAAAELRAAIDENNLNPSAGATERLIKAKIDILEAFIEFAADRPVTGLDFASLYPSLIMTYNLSPEKILLTPEEAEYWKSQGRTLHKIEFEFNGRPVRGWSIRHNNVEEDIGLFPSALIDLFNKRVEMKIVLGVHGAVKELIELITGRAKKDGASITAAAREVLTEARDEEERTRAALAPGAPPPRISPGGTLADEIADLTRLNKNAAGQVKGIGRLTELARKHSAEDAPLAVAIKSEYERACFDWTCANGKQAALKTYMNTFYGEAGNKLSPLFLLQLAGGVTAAGQYNIKLVAELVIKLLFLIKYGDTDSLYLVPPAKYFVECDDDYAAGRLTREEFWSAMVRITMRALNTLRDDVNTALARDNGSKYLKMAYEEVLYPVVFTGKKKYFGIPHLNEVNFRPKKLFIKGIDVVKQGQPGIARTIGHRIMWACMGLDNQHTIRHIVDDVIRDAVVNGAQWKFDDFIKTAAWKPNKKNVSVQRFIARMRARNAIEIAANKHRVEAGHASNPYLYEIPEPGERFGFVLVKSDASFDLHGRKLNPTVGDRMEFASAAKILGLGVDVANYMVSNVIGLCARFINSGDEFQPPASTHKTKKEIDKFSQNTAKKILEQFIKGLGTLDGSVLRKRGVAYRRAFSHAADLVRSELVGHVGAAAASVLHGEWLDFEFLLENGDSPDWIASVIEDTWKLAGSHARVVCDRPDNWNEELALALGIKSDGSDSRPPSPNEAAVRAPRGSAAGITSRATTAAKLYKFGRVAAPRQRRPVSRAIVAPSISSAIDRMEAEVRTKLESIVPLVGDVAGRYEADLEQVVHRMRLDEHTAHPELGPPESAEGDLGQLSQDSPSRPALLGVTAADREVLLEFNQQWNQAVGIQVTRRRDVLFAEYLNRLKDRRLGMSPAPPRMEYDQIIAEAAAKLKVSGDIAVIV